MQRRERLAILAILLLGTTLRLFRLGAESLWYDETVSTYLAGSPVLELLRHTAGDIHPPGYYLLLRAWLVLTGYPTGHADPAGNGLEFASAFFSLFFGVLLIALVYALARKLGGGRVSLVTAALVSLSPFNVWYSQEVRMYTLGAVLALGALWALIVIAGDGKPAMTPYAIYALATASGMYVLYYFGFLLLPLNLWALVVLIQRRRTLVPLLAANIAAAILYAPWLGIAFRQATQPPVPPWRTAPNIAAAILESWTALSFGQSAPAWVRPALLLTLALFVIGLFTLGRDGRDEKGEVTSTLHGSNRSRSGEVASPFAPHTGRTPSAAAVALAVATLCPLILILVISFAIPLYHVRYLFTNSSAGYILLAAGLVTLYGRSRPAALISLVVMLLAAGVTLQAFWFDPAFRADDHRAAVRELQARWRPGDVVVVNAGWAYTALVTYWDGEIGGRYRITGALPEARPDASLVLVTTGHTDGDPGLGWGDPRSDFFAMSAGVARQQVADLFDRFRRVWHYRIYDTVNDPDGLVRALLPRHGQLADQRTYPGEAYLDVEQYAPREGDNWNPDGPGAAFGELQLRYDAPAPTAHPGQTLNPALTWLPGAPVTTTIAVSLRLIGFDGQVEEQPPDEQPLGPLFTSTKWPPGVAQYQPIALTVPDGTLPGEYQVVLVVYDAATGQPLRGTPVNGAAAAPPGLLLGRVNVVRPSTAPLPEPALAEFGPLALVEANTPVTAISPGGAIPVDLLWQARDAPGQPLVVVIQALDDTGAVVAGIEEQPTGGRYPTQSWQAGELVRDRHTLALPASMPPGRYRIIVGVYNAGDRERLNTRMGLLTNDVSWTIKEIEVR